MFFLSMVLELTSQGHPTQSVLQLAVFAHAAVMNLISSVDSAVGRDLHNCRRHKPMSLAILSVAPSRLTLRVAFMGRGGMQAADALGMALSRTASVQLGSAQWQLSGLHCSGGAWGATCTWADLVEPCSSNWLEFSFVTPTAFTKSDGRGNRFVSVLPEPIDVFNSLLDRWNDLDGPNLPVDLVDYIRRGGCIVSDIDIRCVTTQLRERIQKGFIGRVTYELNNRDPAYVSAIHQLGRLAFFSGVGYQTARGMGAVRTRSW
jgi:CRISPR-associated endoribonuclease Cas6